MGPVDLYSTPIGSQSCQTKQRDRERGGGEIERERERERERLRDIETERGGSNEERDL